MRKANMCKRRSTINDLGPFVLAFKCNQLYWHCTPAAGFHDLISYRATTQVLVVSAKQTP